jgi:hypothetical protein
VKRRHESDRGAVNVCEFAAPGQRI